MKITNENYIDEIKSGNTDAIEYVIDTYGNFLYRLAYENLKSKEFAEECINDVFLKVWRCINSFDENKGEFKTWIAKITKNLAIDMIRKNKESIYINIENLEEICGSAENNDELELENEELRVVEKNINTLSDIDRYIFINRFFLGKKVSEISKELNISVNSLRVRIHRGRKKLKELMKK